MSFDLVSAAAPLERSPVTAPLQELRKNQQALAVLVNRLFADLEQRRTDLSRQAEALQRDRQQLSEPRFVEVSPDPGTAAALQDIQSRLASAEAERDAARSDFAECRERLTAALAAQNQAEQSSAAERPQLKQLNEERLELQRQLDAARAQIGQLAGAALDLAAARTQVAHLREELLQARTNTAVGIGANDAERQQQICELELERRSLRAELDTVRRHAAELADHLAETRRQFVEERSEWNAELRHLRRLLERQSQLIDDRSAFGLYGNGGSRGSAASLDPLDKTHESVLGAVMAQFAQLQHDRQVRRPAGMPPDSHEG